MRLTSTHAFPHYFIDMCEQLCSNVLCVRDVLEKVMIKARVWRATLAQAVWSPTQVEQKANDQITVIGRMK